MDHVDIMAGVTTRQFKDFQLKKKLNIPANVILEVVQMISVVATGCHVSITSTLFIPPRIEYVKPIG